MNKNWKTFWLTTLAALSAVIAAAVVLVNSFDVPVPPPSWADDFTWTPSAPVVNQTVVFGVIAPRAGVTYTWDQTADGVADGTGTTFQFTFKNPGTKETRLYADGALVVTHTLDVVAGTGPQPPPIPGPAAVWQAYVAARAARPDAYADCGQWDCLMYEATGDVAHARAAITQALGNWPDLNRNNTREHGQFFAVMYEKLRTHMTADERQRWEAKLRTWAEHMLDVPREGDSDETVGHYLGIRLTDRAIGSQYSLRADNGRVSPATMRGIISEYVAKAKGGQWIESSMYNLGTVSLLLLGVEQLGPDEFPEVMAWLPELAEQLVWTVTADGKDTAQWGDEQNPHDEKLYAWVALACQVIQLGGDKTGKLADLVALRIKDRPVEDYGLSLYRPLWAGFDPATLPTNPTWPNPQGLRATNVGLVIYRKGDVLAQVFFPNDVGVDHRIDGTNIRLYDDGWLVDAPIGYDNVRPLNRALGFGFSAMAAQRLVSADATANGFTAVWTTGGDLRGSWASGNQPRHFVEEMTVAVTYDHATRSLHIVDEFRGREPDFSFNKPEPPFGPTAGPGFLEAEVATIKGAPARWQRVHHMPTEPTPTADGYRWTTKGGTVMELKTTAPKRAVEKCSGVNMRGDLHPEELTGWLVRLMDDTLPSARIETRVSPIVLSPQEAMKKAFPHLTLVVGEHFEDETVDANGRMFFECVFDDCTIEGERFVAWSCTARNPIWAVGQYTLSPGNTYHGGILVGQPRRVVQGVFDAPIRYSINGVEEFDERYFRHGMPVPVP